MHQSSPSIRWIFKVPILSFTPESLEISAVIPNSAGKRSVGTVRTFLEYLSNSLSHPDKATILLETVLPMELFISAEISCNVGYPFSVSPVSSVSHSEALASLHCQKTPSAVRNKVREADRRSCSTQPRFERAEDSKTIFQSGNVAFSVLRLLEHGSLIRE
jgi:hypothetical protein